MFLLWGIKETKSAGYSNRLCDGLCSLMWEIDKADSIKIDVIKNPKIKKMRRASQITGSILPTLALPKSGSPGRNSLCFLSAEFSQLPIFL